MMPLAPSRSRLRRAHSSAIATLLRFSMEMCAGFAVCLILQLRHVQREKLRLGDFRDHPGELFLHELMARDGAIVELLASERVATRRFVAIHGRAQHAPADAVARLRQTTKRRFQTLGAGQADCRQESRSRRNADWR